MKLTKHAQKQAQRRGIDTKLIDFIVSHGAETHAGDGCRYYRISRHEMSAVRRECPAELWKRYRDRLHQITPLVSQEQEVVTTMHRYRPLWKRQR